MSLAVALVLAVFLAGCCTVIKEVPMEQALPEQATPELKLCRTLLEAFLKDDAHSFVANLQLTLFIQTTVCVIGRMVFGMWPDGRHCRSAGHRNTGRYRRLSVHETAITKAGV